MANRLEVTNIVQAAAILASQALRVEGTWAPGLLKPALRQSLDAVLDVFESMIPGDLRTELKKAATSK